MNNDILIETSNDILDIKFNRPKSKNAITREMFEKILNSLDAAFAISQKKNVLQFRYCSLLFSKKKRCFRDVFVFFKQK